MNVYVVELTYIVELEKIDEHLNAHREFLDHNIKENVIIFAGRKNPRNGGVILIKSHNKENVMDVMKNDPFIKFNLADIKIIEVEPTLTSIKFKECL